MKVLTIGSRCVIIELQMKRGAITMIKFNSIIEDKEYRERVIKFFRLPIRLSVSKEKFMSDLEFIKNTDIDRYNMIIEYTEHDFNKLSSEQGTNEPDFTMENILERLLSHIEDTEEWKSFIKKDYSGVLDDYDGITSTHGFYKKDNDGKNFISIDLKSANWQSLQSIIGIDEDYETVIKEYTDNKIPPSSKAFRTKITGVLGAKEIMLYNQKILKDNKYNILEAILKASGVDLVNKAIYAFYADEFLIEINNDILKKLNSVDLSELEGEVYELTGIQVHIRPFTLKWLGVNKACAKVHQDGFEIINISKDILLVMNKLMAGIDIKEIDYEGVKLKDKSKEEFIEEIETALNIIK